MNINQKNVILAILLCGMLGTMTGCGPKTSDIREDLTYTVCGRTQLPDALSEMIEEKKQHAFELSYATKEYLYIAVGYGAHDRANLRVVVEELYKTDRAIYVRTNLLTSEAAADDVSVAASESKAGSEGASESGAGSEGTLESEVISEATSGNASSESGGVSAQESTDRNASTGDASMYPYIVIRCERVELPVIFE